MLERRGGREHAGGAVPRFEGGKHVVGCCFILKRFEWSFSRGVARGFCSAFVREGVCMYEPSLVITGCENVFGRLS